MGPSSPFAHFTPVAATLRRGRRDERRTYVPTRSSPDSLPTSSICRTSPPDGVDLQNIYLSPGLASDDVLRTDLPGDIVLVTCEWDGLRAEAERFKERLGSEGLGKRLLYRNIKGVMHAWDKSPNPLWTDKQAEEVYKEACAVLKVVFEHGKLQTIRE